MGKLPIKKMYPISSRNIYKQVNKYTHLTSWLTENLLPTQNELRKSTLRARRSRKVSTEKNPLSTKSPRNR